MDYNKRLAKVLFDAGVRLVRARDITLNLNFMGLYRDCMHDIMYLMRHIIKASSLLTSMRDASQHHEMANTSDKGGDDDHDDHDNEGDDHDHDNEGGDHDALGSTTPSDHVRYGVGDTFNSTPPC